MDKHFVAYHNRAKQGHTYGNDDRPLRFYASKLNKRSILNDACGNTVWVIEGVPADGGTTYSLCGVYQPDHVEDRDDEKDLIITGGKGKGFHPHIPLNQIPWFRKLLRKLANFSRGFSEIKEKEFIDGLTSLSRSHSNDGLSFDRFTEFLKSDLLLQDESSFLSLLVCSEPEGLTSVDAALMLGYQNGRKNQIVANGIIARIGAKFLNFIGAKRPQSLAPYEVISDPHLNNRDSRGFYRWRARQAVIEAFSGFDETSSAPWQPSTIFYEGAPARRVHLAYERDPVARRRCLDARGYKCEVCGFDFEGRYGTVGTNFAEVHHLSPLAAGEREYSDLRDELMVVCSNCHSMIHRRKEPYTPEEIRAMLRGADGD